MDSGRSSTSIRFFAGVFSFNSLGSYPSYQRPHRSHILITCATASFTESGPLGRLPPELRLPWITVISSPNRRVPQPSSAARLAEAKAINKLFGRDDKMPTILAGDLNAVPDAEPIRELLKHWSNATDEPASPTAPSKKPTSRIDYIFYRPASMFRVSHAEVIEESMASDHRPVLAVFEMSGR